jgi:outer membrane lipoprotein-sorting protein
MKKKVSLILLCLGALLVSTAAAQDQKLTADQIIEKHLAAVGGREALAKFKTRVALGTIKKEDEPDGQLAIMSEAPNKLSVFYGFHDFDLRMIYDGNKAFVRPVLRRDLSSLSDKYQDMLASGFMFNSISLYNLIANAAAGELKFESKGVKKVAGKDAYIVQVKPRKGPQMKLYFDASSFMWVRTDYGSTSVSRQMGTFTNDVVNQGGTEATIDFYIETSDFRDVDGVKLPFRFEQTITAPFLRQKAVGTVTGTIREYRHNEGIDPKMFQ